MVGRLVAVRPGRTVTAESLSNQYRERVPVRAPRAPLLLAPVTTVLRVRGLVSARFRPIRARLAKWDGESLKPESSAENWLHRWLPVAIVLASLAAATMAWQASVAEERATHKDVLSRQDLVREQQIDLEKVQEVDAHLRVFGEFERSRLLANALQRDSARLGGAAGRRLANEAHASRTASDALGSQLLLDPGTSSAAPYDVRALLRAVQTGDRELSSLEPNRLRASARHQRTLALRLTGLLVIFIAALVFLTVAAVARSALSNWFAASGAVTVLVATVLFFVVRFA
jgi:hypothetical protein